MDRLTKSVHGVEVRYKCYQSLGSSAYGCHTWMLDRRNISKIPFLIHHEPEAKLSEANLSEENKT